MRLSAEIQSLGYKNGIAFQRNTPTAAGSQHYRRRACNHTFSSQEPAGSRQLKTSINRDSFKLLCNSAPLMFICTMPKIAPKTWCGRIEFIAQKCNEASADCAPNLLLGFLRSPRRLVSADKPVYVSNWPATKDKRHVDWPATGTVANKTGYVLATTLNFNQNDLDAETRAEFQASGTAYDSAAFGTYSRLCWSTGYKRIVH